MRAANIIMGVIFFFLGIATVITTWLTLPYTSDFSPGPGFLPLWLGICLTAASIPVIVAEFRKKQATAKLFRPETLQCVKALLMIVAVFLLLPVFGFSAGLAMITAGSMRLMGKHGWLACLATFLATAVGIHYIFGQWLSIPLPQGMIGW